MAIVDKIRDLLPSEIKKPDEHVQNRIKRGRERMKEGAAKRNECVSFWRGEQYSYISDSNSLVSQPVWTGNQQGKAPYRVRQVRNLLIDVVAQEVSASTQRIPNYEITPSTTDPQDISAARLAEKVARYGYDKWFVRNVTERVVSWSVLTGEGFAWPYFDNTVGDYMGDDLATGEVRIRVFGPNEVYWEPGEIYEDSRWVAVEHAQPVNEVYAMKGYFGGKLTKDASTSDVLNSKQTGSDQVLVTHYLERPSPKSPSGRWVTMANGRIIVPDRAYPLAMPDKRVPGKFKVCDEPILHRLGYFVDPASDRAMGLVQHLLDPQRTYNDCINRMLEWKNLALNPQVLAPVNSMLDKLTDEPGAVFEYQGQQPPQWRQVPAIPGELQALMQQAQGDIQNIAAQNQVPTQVESGKGIQALIEKDAQRRGSFIVSLADFHSRLMRHCLYLVQRHYTENRLLTIRGDFGPELIQDFYGAKLMGAADVTVLPGSIEPRTKAYVNQQVMTFAQLGWITPEAAMAAINGGTAESLVRSYELDVARANLIIQRIQNEGAEQMLSAPMVSGPNGQMVPDWMPREFDNAAVQIQTFTDWMKTTAYDRLPAEEKEVANLFFQGLKQLQQQQAAEAAMEQQQVAEGMGMKNATRPASPPQSPSLPAVDNPGANGSP